MYDSLMSSSSDNEMFLSKAAISFVVERFIAGVETRSKPPRRDESLRYEPLDRIGSEKIIIARRRYEGSKFS
jgi:hypothetical protein